MESDVYSQLKLEARTQLGSNNETLIVSNFISFFEPLVQNLDSSVVSLRYF
jgi:hypothetical protein